MFEQRQLWTFKIFCLFFLVTTFPVNVAEIGDCEKISSCKCVYEDGDIIDLSPLAGQADPKFKDMPGQGGDELYSWNPCTDFTESGCETVAVCGVRPGIPAPTYVSLGNQASAKFQVDSGDLYLMYSSESHGVMDSAEIKLTCSNGDDTLIVNGPSTEGNIYGFELQSPHACPKHGSSENALSGGSILLISFSSVLFVFCVAGIPIQIFVRKQTGKAAIPMSSFWFTLPGLIKDGVLFIVNRGKGGKSGYDQI